MCRPRFLPVFMAMLAFASPRLQAATDDDWSGDDWITAPTTEPLVLSVSIGVLEGGDSSLGGQLSLPLGDHLVLDLAGSRTRLEDNGGQFDSNDLEARIRFRLGDQVRLLAGWRFQGQSDELEIRQYHLGFAHETGSFDIALRLHRGSATVYSRSGLSGFFDIPERRRTDLSGWSVSLGGSGDDWGWFADWEALQYDDDLSALGRLRLLQLIIEPGALRQTGLLIRDRGSFGLIRYLDRDSWSLGLTQTRNEVDGERSRDLGLDGQIAWGKNRWLLMGIGYGLDAGQPWSASIGLQWIGG